MPSPRSGHFEGVYRVLAKAGNERRPTVVFRSLFHMKDSEFQRELVRKLRSGETSYEQASIYTVLLDLLQGNDAGEVFMVLHNAASDLGVRDEIEGRFEEAREWSWE